MLFFAHFMIIIYVYYYRWPSLSDYSKAFSCPIIIRQVCFFSSQWLIYLFIHLPCVCVCVCSWMSMSKPFPSPVLWTIVHVNFKSIFTIISIFQWHHLAKYFHLKRSFEIWPNIKCIKCLKLFFFYSNESYPFGFENKNTLGL